MTKLYTSLLLSFLCLSLQAQHQIINPTIDPQVKIDSAEVSVEKYLEAFDGKLHAESPEVLELINANGKIWMYYEVPLPKKSKKVVRPAIPYNTAENWQNTAYLPPPVSTSITGLNFDTEAAQSGFYHIPPDVHGAAGTNDIGYVVNTSIDFFTKAGVSRAGFPQSLASFFTSLSPQTTTFDPKILWDQYENRWVVVTLEKGTSPSNFSKIFLAVSATSDPTGTWYFQAVDAQQSIGGNDCWFDYPGFAIDEEAIYVTGNYFQHSGTSCSSSQVLIVDKGTSGGFYAGVVLANDDPAASGGAFTFYDPTDIVGNGFDMTMQPAHGFGTMPAALGTYLVSYSGLNSGGTELVQIISISNPLSSPSFSHFYETLADIEDISVSITDIPQSGSANLIEGNDRRSLNAQWKNDALWVCFNILPASGANAGDVTSYYVKLNATGPFSSNVTPVIFGEVGGEDIGTNVETWNPAICIGNNDNAAIVFSACNANMFASSYVATIDATTGTVSGSNLLETGTDDYYRTFGGSSNRWGDYAAIVIDPVDGDAWAFSQTAISNGTASGGEDGRWGVFIEEFTNLALPVEWLSFEAKQVNGIAQLVWETASEYDCEAFEVQVLDNNEWLSVDRISCLNQTQRATYEVDVPLPKPGNYMFRIKQLDYNGDYSYSAMKSVTWTSDEVTLQSTIYPNPVSDILSIDFDIQKPQNITFDLVSISGQQMWTSQSYYLKGQVTEEVSMLEFPAGIYVLRLESEDQTTLYRIIKSN